MKAIGIDIGGTTIKGCLINESGELLEVSHVPTELKKGREGILTGVLKLIDSFLDEWKEDVHGIGIGTAGRVNVETGQVVYSTDNLPGWQGINLKKELERRYTLPVTVDNDANTALLGEIWKGFSKPPLSAIMMTIGTGVGGAYYYSGDLIRGSHFNGAEWGHVIFEPNGRLCNCGRKGCIEQYISGTALLQTAFEITGKTYSHGRDLFLDYQRGQVEVNKVIDTYLNQLAVVLANFSVTADPDVIILGGGVVDSKSVWWSTLEKKLETYNLPFQLLPAKLGNEAGMTGAAYMLFESLRKRGDVT